MPKIRLRRTIATTVAVLVMGFVMAFVMGCGGITQVSPTAATDSGATDATVESGPAGCPASMPESGAACSLPEGTECSYDASKSPCGVSKCVGGKWEIPFSGYRACPAPPDDPCNKTFDKSCGGDADCSFGIHQTSCCGDTHAVGYNKSQTKAFSDNEAICLRTYPGCGCASRGLETDEGRPESGFLTPTAVKVNCVGGSCKTSPK